MIAIEFPSLRAKRSNLQLAACDDDGWRLLRRYAPRKDKNLFYGATA